MELLLLVILKECLISQYLLCKFDKSVEIHYTTTMLKGIDISHYQFAPNFDLVKNDPNGQFVIAQASFGTGYTDSQFLRNQSELRRINSLRAWYHYAYPEYNPNPVDEAEWFLKVIGQLQEGEVLALDFEEQFSGDIVAWCKGFLDHVASKLNGYKPLLYIDLSHANNPNLNWKPIIDAGYGLWVAWYNYDPNNNNFNTPWPFAAMRQYANNVKVNGIQTITDADIFFGDQTAFQKYGYHRPTPPDYQNICKQVKQEIASMDSDTIKVIKVRELVANV